MSPTALLIALAATAASIPSQDPAADGRASVAPAAVAEGNRRFTLNLYRELAREDGNVFFSAPSIAFALGTVTAGAEGETRAAIGRALSFPSTGDGLHAALGSLQRGLERDGANGTISIANALWLNRKVTLQPAFLDVARRDYDAAVETLDFGGDREGSAARINRWAAEETRGRITQVIEPRALGPTTRLIVSNAVYFLADWETPFVPNSQEGPFTLADGTRIEVPMMAQLGSFRHHAGDGFAALDLPYRDPQLTMTVLLPDEADGLANLEAALTSARLDRILGALDRADPVSVDVRFPKLELNAGYALARPLGRLGMEAAFTPAADFGGISDSPLMISGVSHVTFLRVDEEGTEAAAVTVTDIVVSGSRRGSSPPIVFHANRPFLLMLRDRESGMILFFGRIVRP